MNTHRLKNYLKLGILLFGIFVVLFSCKQDDIENPTEQSNSKYFLTRLKGSELKQNLKLNEKISELKTRTKNPDFQARYENETFDLDLNEATYIESIDGSYHSYTFYIYNDEDNYNINNIVLSITENGDYEADLVTYNLTENEKQQIENGTLTDLKDKMTIEPFDINQINTYSRGGTCMELVAVDTVENCSAGHDVSSCSTECCGGCYDTIYEWQSVDCDGGGGGDSGGTDGGSDGSGSTGGGGTGGTSDGSGPKATSLTGVDDGKPKTKCQSLKVLTQTDSLSANIKPIVDSLKMKTSESKEWYINFRKKMNYGEVYSVPENGGIKESNSIENAKAYVGTFWFGQIHTHPDTRYNMFSWLDLRAMKEIHSEVHSSFKDDAF